MAVVRMYMLLMPVLSVLAQEVCFTDNNIEVSSKKIRSNLYNGQQAFALQMLAAIQKSTPNENIFFSPYSTYNALLLAYFGASGQAEQELHRALRLDWAEHKKHVSNAYRLEKQKRYSRSKRMPLEFVSADKIYFDADIDLLPCMMENFRDELETADFRHNPEGCRYDINSWIANITKNEIPQMLGPGDITTDTQLVLVNSAYFKGKWANQFDPSDTKPGIFYTSKNQYSFVPMMHKRGVFMLELEKLQAYVLKMPYLTSNEDSMNSDISMVIILPPFADDSIERILSKLNPEVLDMVLKEGTPREIDITLPKFDLEENLQLVPILRNIGINSIFDDMDGLNGFSTSSKLRFGDAKHVAKIKVDEEGSTAAAATVLFSFRSARPLEPTKFECNHPFIFLIYDQTAKAILFAGIYRQPNTQN